MPFMGWISPDGEKIKCEYAAHLETADEICEHLGYDPLIQYRNGQIVFDPEWVLLKRGWIKVYTDIYTNLLTATARGESLQGTTQAAFEALKEIYYDEPDCYDDKILDNWNIH